MVLGTKKSIEELQGKFETGDKPTEQDFWDWMASFYHKDEDIAFLINISKATLTDVQAATDNTRFMTALRTYQAILFWVRLEKLPLLAIDVQALIQENIDAMWAELLATDDADNVIDTLGEVFQALKNFAEREGGIYSDLTSIFSSLADHNTRINNAQSKADDGWNRANNAQSKADDAWTRANNAQSSANNAQSTADDAWNRANNAQAKADDAWTRANNAQATANDAWTRANNAQGTADYAVGTIGRPGGTSETVWDRITGVYTYATTVAGTTSYIIDRMDRAGIPP